MKARDFVAAFLFVLIISSIYAAAGPAADSIPAHKKRVLLAQARVEPFVKAITQGKIEAATALALALSGKNELIPGDQRDSAVARLKEKGIKPIGTSVAEELKADMMLFLTISKLKNILRVDAVIYELGDTLLSTNGIGYAQLHYRQAKDSSILYDPSLLEAIQRAFAEAERDTLMYAANEGSFRVKPAAALVIGGIIYKDEMPGEHWEMFTKKEISSYFIMESIFEECIKSDRFVTYDTETRDSVYSLFNVYGVENYRAPNSLELEALNKVAVDYYILGNFVRTAEGAELTLMLNKVSGNSIQPVKYEMGLLKKENYDELKALAKDLTAKLLGIVKD